MKQKMHLFTVLALLAGCSQHVAHADGRLSSEVREAPACSDGGGGDSARQEPHFVQGVERLSYISPRIYGIRESYDACVARMERVQDREECSFDERQFQNARLEKAYANLRVEAGRHHPLISDEPGIVEAQQSWQAFHKANCAAKSLRYGSNYGPATSSECDMLGTAARAQELEDWLGSLEAMRN